MNVLKNKQVFLFLCNKPSVSAIDTFKDIHTTAKLSGNDAILLYHKQGRSAIPENLSSLPIFCFTDNILSDLGYISLGSELVPGNNHFPVLKFFRNFPDYDYYWYIEDDVRYTGNWKLFFDSFSNVHNDFISTHVQRSHVEPQWPWWDTLKYHNKSIPMEKRIRSFNPIYRISKEALHFIDQALLDGWCGHHEVLLPTLLANAGSEIMDFGGEGEFVLSGNESKFYIGDYTNNTAVHNPNTTFRWRPVFTTVGSITNILYHPVKN
ncbi:DUF3405 domain-containing protein [Sinomicrobium kalidii]|uniref:DUF3405 domain-containing protein n=1 Tax=Sinomicrobium kalidii TaxID=2900738 RepID=UPI001E4C2411|nr:DUF3405 domain-containing protein [Sinomicrobium kalidii]UGU15235.1 DUF3405 domain-containing protein [Sinomicrobium kalidii]